MRRSKQTAEEPAPDAAPPSSPAPRVQPARPEPVSPPPPPPALSAEDLDRGRTAALIATLGRVQLTLDLIERRLGRLEDAVLDIQDILAVAVETDADEVLADDLDDEALEDAFLEDEPLVEDDLVLQDVPVVGSKAGDPSEPADTPAGQDPAGTLGQSSPAEVSRQASE